MCGIAGFVGRVGDSAATLRDWGRVLAHRGPDDLGIAVLVGDEVRTGKDPGLIMPQVQTVLWHRRLSILDLSAAGWQPMSSRDGRHHLILNGEVYNYRELRAELEGQGVVFHSASDTEVVLEGYRLWGVDLLPRLVGMFAFALLDREARRVLLARDPFGIKPLYWSAWPGAFAFASEQKALLKLPQVSRRADPQGLFDYLRFGLTDHGDSTMLQAIRSCPPAHWLQVSCDDARVSAPVRYLDLHAPGEPAGSFEDSAARLRELFLDSVRLHLRSDVPVGAALSGGIDSSAIVMAMKAVEPAVDLHAFSYIATDAALSEERWVDVVGQASGAIVHKTHATPEDLLADLDGLLSAQDEPFGSTSIYAQHRVFRLAREHGIKVMLDGQGADELLGGYQPFVAARLASLLRQGRLLEAVGFAQRAARAPGRASLWLWAGEFLVPPALQAPFRRLVGQDLVPSWLDGDWFAERGVRLQPAKYTFGDSSDVLHDQLRRAVSRSSLPMLLRYEDRNSMAYSIESRVPFLTPQLARFVLSLPESYLIDRDGTTKAVFRRAMRGLVPDVILDRQDKIGFATPEQRWLRQLSPVVERILASDTAAAIPMLRLPVLRAEWQAMKSAPPGRDFRAWRWINLIEWVRRSGVVFS